MDRRQLLMALAAAPTLGLSGGAMAQATQWPQRGINIIVPFPTGRSG